MRTRDIYMGSTKIPPTRTIGEISALLVKAGALNISTDFGPGGSVLALSFALPVGKSVASFRLPCRTEQLVKLIRDKAQAERTAWRQILRWVEAQIALSDVGMAKPAEVFMPYALLGSGQSTMYEQWESHTLALPAAGGKQ